jgi:replicative DNA helicase
MNAVPHSPEAEKAVLGCCLAQPNEVMDEVYSVLSADDFFSGAFQEIFKALGAMRGSEAIDVMTVHHYLEAKKLAAPLGSPGILAELLVGFATHLNIGSYIRIVKDKSRLRQLQAHCQKTLDDIGEMPDSVPSVMERAEKGIMEITEPGRSPSICNATGLTASFEAYLGQIDRGERFAAVKTGYSALDRINGGLKPGGMHVIGGRTGLGKSTVMFNLAENLCEAGTGVGIISLEMSRDEVAASIYSFMADINSRRFKDKLDEEQWNSVRWASGRINKWNLQIDDCSLVDVFSMRHKVRKMVKDGAGVVFIDYLQLMESREPSGKQQNRAMEVAEMSRSIKLLAKETGVPIVIGAQLNRQAAQGEPGLHQLRESGAIEQDADGVAHSHYLEHCEVARG